MDAEMSHGVTDESDDRIAEQAASFDEALAAGRDPFPVPADDFDGLSALLAAQASLQIAGRVWPRSAKMEIRSPVFPVPQPQSSAGSGSSASWVRAGSALSSWRSTRNWAGRWR